MMSTETLCSIDWMASFGFVTWAAEDHFTEAREKERIVRSLTGEKLVNLVRCFTPDHLNHDIMVTHYLALFPQSVCLSVCLTLFGKKRMEDEFQGYSHAVTSTSLSQVFALTNPSLSAPLQELLTVWLDSVPCGLGLHCYWLSDYYKRAMQSV